MDADAGRRRKPGEFPDDSSGTGDPPPRVPSAVEPIEEYPAEFRQELLSSKAFPLVTRGQMRDYLDMVAMTDYLSFKRIAMVLERMEPSGV